MKTYLYLTDNYTIGTTSHFTNDCICATTEQEYPSKATQFQKVIDLVLLQLEKDGKRFKESS
jgi:hypothetical protein